jgi:effector-binding domain-containing protein
MSYEVDTVEVAPVPYAHIKRRGRLNQIGEFAMAVLDTVWATVREAGLVTNHNVFTYRAVGGDQFDMEFGVQVAEGSELPPGDVSIGITPSGRALHTLHVGTYDKLGEAFDAVYAYAAHESIDVGTPGWEVYGDWTDDASRLETDVYVMLA